MTRDDPPAGHQPPVGQPPARRGRSSSATPGVALFLVGFDVVWASLAAVNAFYSIQIVALGGSTGLVGIAWAVGAVIEVPLMYAFPRIGAACSARSGWSSFGALAFALRALPGVARRRPGGARPHRAARGHRLRMRLRRWRDRPRGASAGGSAGDGAGPVRRCQRAGDDHRLGRRRRHRRGHRHPGLFAVCAGGGLIGTAIVALALLRPRSAIAARPERQPPVRQLRRTWPAPSRSVEPGVLGDLEHPVDEQVLPDERLDLGDLAGVGRVGLDQQVVDLRRDLCTCPPGRASRTGRRARMASSTARPAGSRRSGRARAARRRRRPPPIVVRAQRSRAMTSSGRRAR